MNWYAWLLIWVSFNVGFLIGTLWASWQIICEPT